MTAEGSFDLPILMYHHLEPDRTSPSPYNLTPDLFSAQLKILQRRGFTTFSFQQLFAALDGKRTLPARAVVLTFDDGYADLAEYALPVLHRYGFGAAVYIVTRQLGGTNVWDAARGAPLSLITAGQIRFWASQGIDFGAHSRTHADLRDLPARELSEEVVGSGKDLEAILGTKVVSFAYPYGFHNRAVDDCVRSAFDLAFIADDENEGLNSLETDPHQLLRTMVQSSDSLLAMKFRSRWGRYPFLNLLSRIRVRIALRTRLRHAMGVAVHGNKR